jgi:MOSC domain-containing protein YiiM
MAEESIIKALMNNMPQVGEVTHITIRPERRAQPELKEQVEAFTTHGLEGDHFRSKSSDKRQVTLIQLEHLDVVGSIMGLDEVDPRLTRRNIVVKGINLLALKGQKFQIGDAVMEGTGPCEPCSRMEENFGEGGYNAMRGHGGLTARVIQDGTIRVGDKVRLVV